jgi:hypothetical protein
MTTEKPIRVALLYPGDAETRRMATAENNRFAPLFAALTAVGAHPEPAVYHDELCAQVRAQLLAVDAVLVWVNPIHEGRDRTQLDAMLREVTASGVFVSAHPDIILKMGTKEVLYTTRSLGWGSDVRRYNTMTELQQTLPGLLMAGDARVLKQVRGHSGIGVWKVELAQQDSDVEPSHQTLVRVRHAQRGCTEEEIALGAFFARCEPYFANHGKIIDQPYQERLNEGMFRCYLVHDQVAGFGHQAINALYPAPAGAARTEAPQPGARLYYPPTMPEAQPLKRKMEQEFLPAMLKLLDIAPDQLPILWDADFMLGSQTATDEERYVLCEINVSSVAPFPDSAIPLIAKAVLTRARSGR